MPEDPIVTPDVERGAKPKKVLHDHDAADPAIATNAGETRSREVQ